MKKPTVLLTRALPEACMKTLEEHCELEYNPVNEPMRRDRLLEQVRGKDGLIGLGQ
jgi:hypothetical protein